MDPNKVKMAGDLAQKTPPSLFGFDVYPTQTNSFVWRQNMNREQYLNSFVSDSSPAFSSSSSQQAASSSSQQAAIETSFPTGNITSQTVASFSVPSSSFNNPNMSSALRTNNLGVSYLSHTCSSQIQNTSSFSFPTEPVASSFNFGSSKPQEPVQFPFNITTNTAGDRMFCPVRGKRKTESPPLRPNKQHITEEKMAEHLSQLHISSESEPAEMEEDAAKEKRLYMCEEMRKLQSEPIVPQCLLARMESPCKAVVLWQPPVPLLVPPLSVNMPDENSNTENNNEENLPDNNAMLEIEEISGNVLEANDGEMEMDAA